VVLVSVFVLDDSVEIEAEGDWDCEKDEDRVCEKSDVLLGVSLCRETVEDTV
jgi:hypothetical protein